MMVLVWNLDLDLDLDLAGLVLVTEMLSTASFFILFQSYGNCFLFLFEDDNTCTLESSLFEFLWSKHIDLRKLV